MEKPLQIVCPNCGKEISLDESLTKKLEQLLWPSFSQYVTKESNLKLREQEKVISDLKKQLRIALRKVELTPIQLKGEVQELEILQTLGTLYPTDIVTQTKKATNGADILQRVCLQNGNEVGTIYIESKRTESWSNDWIDKLKSDNLKIHADLVVIISQTLPKNVERYAMIDNVWVTDFNFFKELLLVLRYALIKIHSVATIFQDKEAKQTKLYDYLISPEFKGIFESLLISFQNIKDSHEAEKIRTLRTWKERELLHDKILSYSIELYSSLKGTIGDAMPEIKSLESPKEY